MSRTNRYVMTFDFDPLADSTPTIRTDRSYPLKVGCQYRLYFDFKKHKSFGSGGKFYVSLQDKDTWGAAGVTRVIRATSSGTIGEWARKYCKGGSALTWPTTQTFTATASPCWLFFRGEWPAGTGTAVSIDNVVLEPAPTMSDVTGPTTAMADATVPTTAIADVTVPTTEMSDV